MGSKIQCRRDGGFTIIEFVVAVTLIIIIASRALPAFHPLAQGIRLSGTVNTLERSIRLARQEAVMRNQTIRLCASADGQGCDPNRQWLNGYIVFIDLSKDRVRQPDEPLVEVRNLSAKLEVHFNRIQPISFNGLGRAMVNGTLTICDPHGRISSKEIILIHSGRIRKRDGSKGCG